MFGNDTNKLQFLHEDIKSRSHSGNACYHLDKNLSSPHLLSKDLGD